jgi:hypothetical protein
MKCGVGDTPRELGTMELMWSDSKDSKDLAD